MRLGVPGTEAAPQTDSPSSTGRMPSPHPELNPADPEPSLPDLPRPNQGPHPDSAELNAGREIPTANLTVPISWGQPAATITAYSLWFPSQALWFPSRPCGSHPGPVVSWVLAPTGTAPSARDAPVYPIDTRSPLQAPPAPGAPPEPPREARPPLTSPSPFTTSESPLHSFASLPGFRRTLEGRG